MPIARVAHRVAMSLACAASVLIVAIATAHPVHGLRTELRQPDGTELPVRIWGDEFHQRIEDLDGFTLIRDPADGRICFAEQAADGSLRSTGMPADGPRPGWISPGLDLTAERLAEKLAEARRAAGWRGPAQDKIPYPLPASTGAVRGIAILVDFGDEPATIDPEALEPFLNDVGYTGGGNNGSVRDYFHDVSGGRLDLTHEVSTYYYRASRPKSWYEDPSALDGWRARLLVEEALADLERRGFDFHRYDANGDGYVDLVSCFYAGQPSWGWSVGLWPRAGVGSFSADGVAARLWQISPLGDSLRIGTPVHEIGHALLQWPDLYDQGNESFGLGRFCIMSAIYDQRNPGQPCGPLKFLSGWTRAVELDGVMPDVVAPVTGNRVFTVHHPTISTELYVIENRRRVGRDADLPDEGLAIWHVDWLGSNNREVMSPDLHYMVTLVQADGRWDLEGRQNMGDETDLFGGPHHTEFNADSTPSPRWWRSPEADINIHGISEPGDTMTFDFADGIGIHPIDLVVDPIALAAPWRVTGADGFVKVGDGTRAAFVPVAGSYLVTWRDVPGWTAPPAVAVYVDGGEVAPRVQGSYTHPPFQVTEVPLLAPSARTVAGQAVDYDDDGDLDLYLCRRDGPDLLLRNEGGWEFTDQTPEALTSAASSIGVQWADVDADGDRDVLVVGDGEPPVLLRRSSAGEFVAPEPLADEIGAVRGAVWVDYDRDNRLDLHLVRDGERDLLLRLAGDAAAGFAEYERDELQPGISFARTQVGAWCDYDGDGRPDLYAVNLFGSNVLINNRMPAGMTNVTVGALGLPWRGGTAAWGDLDNDGDFDLYNVQDGAADMVFSNFGGVFILEPSLRLMTPGAGKDVVWADFDNDGHLDIFLAREDQPDRLLLADGRGSWDESPLLIDLLDGPSVGSVAADFDADGGVDLAILQDGQPTLLLHNSMSRGHWLQVVPRWDGPQPEPVGVVVAAHAGDQVFTRHVQSRSGPTSVARQVHLGLGSATVVDSLRVVWPDGVVQVERDVAADQTLHIVRSDRSGADDRTPRITELRPPFPNPFNPGTTIACSLARPANVVLTVYDVRGRKVVDLHQGPLASGNHTFRWDGSDGTGRDAAAGVYLVRFRGDGVVQHQRMTLIR